MPLSVVELATKQIVPAQTGATKVQVGAPMEEAQIIHAEIVCAKVEEVQVIPAAPERLPQAPLDAMLLEQLQLAVHATGMETKLRVATAVMLHDPIWATVSKAPDGLVPLVEQIKSQLVEER